MPRCRDMAIACDGNHMHACPPGSAQAGVERVKHKCRTCDQMDAAFPSFGRREFVRECAVRRMLCTRFDLCERVE